LAKAGQGELEGVIRSIGLFRNKAKNLIELAQIVSTTYGGVVPGVREALEALPGVGRKTASVVLAQGFGVPAFAVDTHVGRVSRRLGFTKSDNPVKVEQAMTALLKPEKWASAHLTLIRHGRTVCKAPKPLCESCPVRKLCPYPKSADAR
jgi:endonuclease-3